MKLSDFEGEGFVIGTLQKFTIRLYNLLKSFMIEIIVKFVRNPIMSENFRPSTRGPGNATTFPVLFRLSDNQWFSRTFTQYLYQNSQSLLNF